MKTCPTCGQEVKQSNCGHPDYITYHTFKELHPGKDYMIAKYCIHCNEEIRDLGLVYYPNK